VPQPKPRHSHRSRPPRWRRRKDARPEEILAAALDVFVERGYAAARLDEVARKAGVTKGTIYLYFPGKEALFKAVIRGSVVPRIERAEQAVAEHRGSAAEALRALVRAMWQTVGETNLSGLPKLIVSEAANFPDLARFYWAEVAGRMLRLLVGIVESGIARGEFRAVTPRHAALAAVAPVLFAVIWKHSLYPVSGMDFDFRAFLDAHLENFLRGLVHA
jgi:AcrR family transcriptional regulator